MYLEEVISQSELCAKNNEHTAIHTRSASLEVFRQFKSTSEVAESIRRNGDALSAWSEWSFWKCSKKELEKLEREVVNRMKRHGKQHPVYTRGVIWQWMPILIHAYKFEPDPILKLELIIPARSDKLKLPAEIPLMELSDVLRAHDYLVPFVVGEPLRPFTRHEAKFITLSEFLDATMPPDAAATQICKKIFSSVPSGGASHSQSEWKAEAPSLDIPSSES